MSAPDPGDMVREDVEKFQQYQGQGLDTGIPALIELAFLSLTGLTMLVWLVAIFWVPDPIDGQAWMSIGMLGLVLFGLPAGAMYVLRRGGAETILLLIRQMG